MKTFALSALFAIAIAEEAATEAAAAGVETKGEATLNPHEFGSFKTTGKAGETMVTDGADQGLYIWVTWNNYCDNCNFEGKKCYVQNYMQWESATEAGKFDGFSCTAGYDRSNGVASAVGIINYKASDSLAGEQGPWSEYGTKDTEYAFFIKEEDPQYQEEFYGRTYKKNTKASQNCGAVGMIWGSGANAIDELNEMYWMLKNKGESTVWTGAKLYEESTDDKPTWWSDETTGTTLSYADWGLTDPNAGTDGGDDTGSGEETSDNATALLSSAAALLTAFLMF